MSLIKHNLRTIIFGIEDSFVSTTGVIVGLIAAGTPRPTVLAAGVITIVVEATSMGAGEFVSNDDKPGKSSKDAEVKGIIMVVSYLLSGIWIMLPIFLNQYSNYTIAAFTLVNLFALGYWRGHLIGGNKLKYALRTLLISGIACGLGIGVGFLFR
jgi:VIT1/CCC1 family predicted Fe2+/Mn2+ transporter